MYQPAKNLLIRAVAGGHVGPGYADPNTPADPPIRWPLLHLT